MPLVMKLIHYLYDADILSEEVIIQWYERESVNKETSQGHKDIRKQVYIISLTGYAIYCNFYGCKNDSLMIIFRCSNVTKLYPLNSR